MTTLHRTAGAFGSALILLMLATPALHAQVEKLSDFEAQSNTQTGPTTTTSDGWYFNSRLDFTNSTDVTAATLTYPGAGSPVALTPNGSTELQYQTGFYASQADLDAAFPDGAYTADYSGGTVGNGSVSVDLTQHPYPNQPVFTAATYTGAQGLDAGSGFTFAWNDFTNPTSDAFVFFNLTDTTTNMSVYSGSFLPTSTTSIFVPGMTLLAGTSYSANVDFSNRIDGTNNGVTTFQGFDKTTHFGFTTAPVPELSSSVSFGLLWASLFGVSVWRVRRKRSA